MASKPLPDDWITCERNPPALAIGSHAPHETLPDSLWFMDKTDTEGHRRVERAMARETADKTDSGA